jgi:hypothetical protein
MQAAIMVAMANKIERAPPSDDAIRSLHPWQRSPDVVNHARCSPDYSPQSGDAADADKPKGAGVTPVSSDQCRGHPLCGSRRRDARPMIATSLFEIEQCEIFDLHPVRRTKTAQGFLWRAYW